MLKHFLELLDPSLHQVFSPTYLFKAPLSPHHAAQLENTKIDPEKLILPKSDQTLVIEMAGGIFVPLNYETLSIDRFCFFKAQWIIVSKHYLGSINHTLLTIEALKKRNRNILGLVFNGRPNPESEKAILEISKVPLFGRLYPEKKINRSTIEEYAKKWQQ